MISQFKMDPVYFNSVFIQFVFIVSALLSQAASSLDNHPVASQERIDSSQFPSTNPMSPSRHETVPYRSSGGRSLPQEMRLPPDKILLVSESQKSIHFYYIISSRFNCNRFGQLPNTSTLCQL